MKLKIKAPQSGVNLTVPVPNALLLNPAAAFLIAKKISVSTGERCPEELEEEISGQLPKTVAPGVDPKKISKLFKQVRKYKRRHPDWVLLDVETDDGTKVTISM